MKSHVRFHKVQNLIMQTLQYATRARYSELQHAARMESDTFKFHIKKLIERDLIAKVVDGSYELTAEGKATVSRLDAKTGREIEQPKSSMLMVVRSGNYVLSHRRMREPFNGFWGIASAPVLRGVPLAESATHELKKQTGLDAQFRVAGAYRVIDKNCREIVLEDKIFAVMVANLDRLTMPTAWSGGESEWVSVDELLSRKPLFPITAGIFEMLEAGIPFREDTCIYRDKEY